MKSLQLLSCAILGLSLAAAARAATPVGVQLEISSLLVDIRASGCEFYRNGSWYDSERAEAHLRMKYQALAMSTQFATAEDFIARVATRSGLSGEPYRIRCPGAAVEPSDQWLLDRLIRNRASSAAGTARAGYQPSF